MIRIGIKKTRPSVKFDNFGLLLNCGDLASFTPVNTVLRAEVHCSQKG